MKGLFTQCMCILTDGKTTIEDIIKACQQHGLTIVKQTPASDNWQLGGPSVTVEYRPESNGYAIIDCVNTQWPDGMGDPASDPMLFGAWSMGHFGPFTFPGGLSRAGQHCWTWEEGRTVSERHRGFIRVRLSYATGADKDAPVIPDNYDPLSELIFLSTIIIALMNVPGALCYFNPNGEALRDLNDFKNTFHEAEKQNRVPLLLWMNVRFFKLTEELYLMDTVGNNQIDVTDVEAVFPVKEYEAGTIDYYLRNVTHYLLDSKPVFSDNESIDGPNESILSWMINLSDRGAVTPPREVLRLFPGSLQKDVRAILSSIK